jgi:hypothetical protein
MRLLAPPAVFYIQAKLCCQMRNLFATRALNFIRHVTLTFAFEKCIIY